MPTATIKESMLSFVCLTFQQSDFYRKAQASYVVPCPPTPSSTRQDSGKLLGSCMGNSLFHKK